MRMMGRRSSSKYRIQKLHFSNNIFGGRKPLVESLKNRLSKGIVRKTILFVFLGVVLIGTLWFYVAVISTLPQLSDISK